MEPSSDPRTALIAFEWLRRHARPSAYSTRLVDRRRPNGRCHLVFTVVPYGYPGSERGRSCVSCGGRTCTAAALTRQVVVYYGSFRSSTLPLAR
jgi:hypothetical protein